MESGLTHLIYDCSPVWVQNLFCSYIGYQNKKLRYTKRFDKILDELSKSEWWSLGDLKALQNERLSKLVEHAYRTVPYYREVMDRLKLKPEDVRTVEDLPKLPVLEKQTVRERFSDLISTEAGRRDKIFGHTSGTTGTALHLLWSRESVAFEFATVWRLRRRFGADLDQPHATFAGRRVVPVKQSSPPFWRENRVLKQTLFSLYHMTPQNLMSYYEQLERTRYSFLTGFPSILHLMATFMDSRGLRLGYRPHGVFVSAESLLAFQIEVMERAFSTTVYDRYGMAEFCASMTQCEVGRMHEDMEFGVIEREDERTVPDGVTANLLCTGLANTTMPLIRYRSGDTATFATTPCACGRHSTSVTWIEGRMEDYVVTPEGLCIARLDYIFKDMGHIRESQILQETTEAITVRVVRDAAYGAADEKELLEGFRRTLGERIRIDIEYVEAIPRLPSGKYRWVESKVGRMRSNLGV